MTGWMVLAIASAIIAILAVAALLIARLRWQRALQSMDTMLDAAISGDFSPENYDESQISKLEAKLARYLATAKLRRGSLEEEKGKIHALISDISHQTKTPIANIQLYLELLAEQPELSEQSKMLTGQLSASTSKLAFLIQALMKASRLEAGIIQVRPEAGELYALVMAAATDYSAKAAEKRIALHLPKEDPVILAKYDLKWCGEAVGNIIDNAIKYTPSGGSIKITLHEYEMFACIQVENSGKGISEADLPKIFERFYRAADSVEADGVGIGLYLAREIISRCGGYIQATSPKGRSSVFSIYLSKV